MPWKDRYLHDIYPNLSTILKCIPENEFHELLSYNTSHWVAYLHKGRIWKMTTANKCQVSKICFHRYCRGIRLLLHVKMWVFFSEAGVATEWDTRSKLKWVYRQWRGRIAQTPHSNLPFWKRISSCVWNPVPSRKISSPWCVCVCV